MFFSQWWFAPAVPNICFLHYVLSQQQQQHDRLLCFVVDGCLPVHPKLIHECISFMWVNLSAWLLNSCCPLRLHELRKDFERKQPVRKLDWSKVRPRQNRVIGTRGLNIMNIMILSDIMIYNDIWYDMILIYDVIYDMGHARLLVWYLGISKSIHLSLGIVMINRQYSEARPKWQFFPQLFTLSTA